MCLIISIAFVLMLICAVATQTYTYDNYEFKQYTRNISLQQGVLQGVIVDIKSSYYLPSVEQYLGIPYAGAPTGQLRFMPPGSAPKWGKELKYMDKFGAVCPQNFPNLNNMNPSRREYVQNMMKYLQNQSEDCLFLNIYVPLDISRISHPNKYSVMVYIHGESFEWNSGNLYDGSVLAAYGKVIVVTLNFRLGILGFLKVGLEEYSSSNFGLLDQIAALFWIQQNIAAFGGDPNSITLFGHGSGAACISLLTISPMVMRDNSLLFHRAILMSGTALSDWALVNTSRQITYQVAEALNCPTDEKLASCLRKKRYEEIMNVSAATEREYMTKFGPIVDSLVVPNDPDKIMSTYSDIFQRFELMYGVTEIESSNLLGPIAFTYGLLEKERDQELRKYLYARCEYKPELYLAKTLALYNQKNQSGDFFLKEFDGPETDRATLARDMLLDMLSDARTVAPIGKMARYHSKLNAQSYFYVFGHTTLSKNSIRNKTSHGEELPYVFGAPLDSQKFHFSDHYNNQERQFSQVVMSLWSNFAYSGNPNVHRQNDYLTFGNKELSTSDIEWPEFDNFEQRYLYLAIPPEIRQFYRKKELTFWNDDFANLLNNTGNIQYYPPKQSPHKPTGFPVLSKDPNKAWFPFPRGTNPIKINKQLSERKSNDVAYGKIKLGPLDDELPATKTQNQYGTVITAPSPVKGSGTAMIVLIAVGGVFLVINVILFFGLYYRCTKIKSRSNSQKRSYAEPIEPREGSSEKRTKLDHDDDFENGCGIMKMISKSSKSGDTYEAVRISEDGSTKYKLSRQMSASTIDPHTKVRDWIANEIVQRCSPKFVRKPRHNSPEIKKNPNEFTHIRTDSKTTESYSTLGKSPTRPVSPSDEIGKCTGIPKPKAQKVSVGIDATPAARSPSVLRQQPIELTKSLDYSTDNSREVSMRRSATLDNFLENRTSSELRRSFSNIATTNEEPVIVKIEHHHSKSKSEPVQDSFGNPIYATPGKKMKTFDPNADINVTSREEDDAVTPLTPEESLQTIKRRNFPKVLPEFPDKQKLAQNRRSMPVSSQLFMTIPENPSFSQPNSPINMKLNKYPPAPPPRGCSSLGRRNIQSPVMLAEEPPTPPEPEITCNNLYVGPLLPTKENRKIESTNNYLDTQPIYDNLRNTKPEEKDKKTDKQATTIITADPNHPIKKIEPKVIIKPTMTRIVPETKNRTIPRVMMKDGKVETKPDVLAVSASKEIESTEEAVRVHTPINEKKLEDSKIQYKAKTPSQIPKLIKSSNPNLNKAGSSESSPSDESETGTVIKRV